MESRTFAVRGIKCEHCKANVERALCSLPGVESAVVSMGDKNVRIEYDATAIAPEDMKNAVEDAGRYEMIL